ncbi:MAG: NAD(P)-dependent oxidoreductase [Melioribacteraceae bacterium]|nr:NAD(P)-dependent oxidoreductase [Melioribacteraceae bacterium]WKZ68714.1 MAG: NAD(P)-dependent oxidoreductase [Melioribacteraceae bacterium]
MNIGLIGTGLMGKPMAIKIKQARFNIAIYNRTKEKAKALQNEGIYSFNSVKELIEATDVILLVVSDYNAITNVLFTEDLSFENKTIIQMSTISPNESILLQNRITKLKGHYFEAPVLGSTPQIDERKLIVLIGGQEEDEKKYSKLFSSFSNKIVFIGEVGKASAIKLALNQLIASETAAFSMSLGYLRERNVDVEKFMDILRGSALYAPTFDKKLPNYMQRDFSNPNFPLKHLLKDVRLMISQFNEGGINTLLLEGVEKVIREGLKQKLSEKDYSSLYNVIHPPK